MQSIKLRAVKKLVRRVRHLKQYDMGSDLDERSAEICRKITWKGDQPNRYVTRPYS